MNSSQKIIAKAIRVQVDSKTDSYYLVFEVTDEEFKKNIRNHWLSDIELELDGKILLKKEV